MSNKAFAGVILIIFVIILCFTYSYRGEWWAFIDIFCFFMGAFLHLLASMQPAALRKAAHKIDLIAMVFMLVGVVAFIGEAIAFYCIS